MATPEKLFVSETFEMSTDNPGTDSYGSKSDHSGKFVHRPRMDVVVVIDLNHHSGLSDRKKAFDEVKITCASMNNVAVHQIQVSCTKLYNMCNLTLCIRIPMLCVSFIVIDSVSNKVIVRMCIKIPKFIGLKLLRN